MYMYICFGKHPPFFLIKQTPTILVSYFTYVLHISLSLLRMEKRLERKLTGERKKTGSQISLERNGYDFSSFLARNSGKISCSPKDSSQARVSRTIQ